MPCLDVLQHHGKYIYIFLSCLVNIFSVFLCYPIMCFYVLSSVLWCPLRFPHKNDFGYLCLFAYSGVHHILCCFVFLRVMYPVLPVSLDCPFLAHLAKGNVSFFHHLASVVRRLSSVNFSHFNLLLWNPSAKWTETW